MDLHLPNGRKEALRGDFPDQQRFVIVSNRLPFTVRLANNGLQFDESVGGLVTGLKTYLASSAKPDVRAGKYVWVGWPGRTIEPALQDEVRKRARQEYQSHPVFLTEAEMETFYYGFCNRTIWPLFHYFPSFTIYEAGYWQDYKHVNEMFCDALMEVVRPGDVVWIQDYHLMLLPDMLRKRMPEIPIGFFLHIPFPSFELFRLIPGRWRREILNGLLGSDLIGFHTYDYTQHFLKCVLRILGHEHNMGEIMLPNRHVKVETFPMGVDFDRFFNAGGTPEVEREKEKLKAILTGVKVILSVDRLDYSKGILNRLEGFELLLENTPAARGKVVLIMVVVPSRIGVDQYGKMKKQIEELIGRINGKFGGINWTPILYQYRTVEFESLVAMYGVSDIALVTPLRDGMNLIAKEYVASRVDAKGVLILSEMAGAAKELGEAIIINPNDRMEIADALREALEMPEEEQVRRNQIMQKRLRRYNVVKWADEFLTTLVATSNVQIKSRAKVMSGMARHELLDAYRNNSSRLLLLDYDGTLVPFSRAPHRAAPPPDVVSLLRKLADDETNTVVLISGRDKGTLTNWFGTLPIHLVAEHGIWLREVGHDWIMPKQQSDEWKPHILPILESYADRLPGSFIEEKDYSLVWHYRASDPEHSQVHARELRDHLLTYTANIDLQVLPGNKVIEVRNAGTNKGIAALHWIAKAEGAFMLAIGDDWTDEDLFMVLPRSAYSIKVGVSATHARFNLLDPAAVVELLRNLADVQTTVRIPAANLHPG